MNIFRFSEEILRLKKIVYRQTSDRLVVSIDNSGSSVDKTVHVIVHWAVKLIIHLNINGHIKFFVVGIFL